MVTEQDTKVMDAVINVIRLYQSGSPGEWHKYIKELSKEEQEQVYNEVYRIMGGKSNG